MEKGIRKSQGAFEYILLLGGVLLIVVVSIIILRGSVLNQANKQIVGNTNAWQNTVCIPTYLGDSATIAVYHFDENSGAIASDASGKGRNLIGVLSGQWVSGKKGSALSFTGSSGNTYVHWVGTLPLPSQWTIEAWIYPTAQLGYMAIVQTDVARDQALYVIPGQLCYWSNGCAAYGNTVTKLNKWQHVAVVFDGTIHTYYYDGANDGSETLTTGNWDNVAIGSSYAGDPETWIGMIDEVIIYNRALSQQEIQKDMNCMG